VDHDVVERVRCAIYDTFASHGHAPSRQQIRDLAAMDEAQVNEAVAELAAQRHLMLDQSGNVVMAHPFTTVNLGFSVMGERNLWWGGCAWDSFAIPNLVKDEPSVLVATTCPACRRPLAWTVTRSGPPEGPEVAHFLVPMDKVWNDVVYACIFSPGAARPPPRAHCGAPPPTGALSAAELVRRFARPQTMNQQVSKTGLPRARDREPSQQCGARWRTVMGEDSAAGSKVRFSALIPKRMSHERCVAILRRLLLRRIFETQRPRRSYAVGVGLGRLECGI
jgi:hypothetical protein